MKTAKCYMIPYVDWNRESDKGLMNIFSSACVVLFVTLTEKRSEIMIYSQTLPHFASKCLTFGPNGFPCVAIHQSGSSEPDLTV